MLKTINATIWVAEHETNDFMQCFDLKGSHLVYCKPIGAQYKTNSKIDKKYFMKIIANSKKDKKKWIAAIQYNNNIYAEKGVKILSDGVNEYFINKK